MKKRDLLKQAKDIARKNDIAFEIIEGGNHSIMIVGGQKIPVPRHREVDERLARKILRDTKDAAQQ